MNMISLPYCASSRLLPERKPSPSPTSSSREPTPQAMPNMVRNERSLCAQRVDNDCRTMSRRIRMSCNPHHLRGIGGGSRTTVRRGVSIPPNDLTINTQPGHAKFPARMSCLDRSGGKKVSPGGDLRLVVPGTWLKLEISCGLGRACLAVGASCGQQFQNSAQLFPCSLIQCRV